MLTGLLRTSIVSFLTLLIAIRTVMSRGYRYSTAINARSCPAFYCPTPLLRCRKKTASDTSYFSQTTSIKNIKAHKVENLVLFRRSIRTKTSYRSSVRLRGHALSQNTLVSGIADVGSVCSLCVLWSELSIATTGCGPYELPDWLERLSYEGVIVVAGAVVFNRIVTGNDLANTAKSTLRSLDKTSMCKVRAAEWLSLLVTIGAFGALGIQYSIGTNMDGLSGIDVDMCRSMQKMQDEINAEKL